LAAKVVLLAIARLMEFQLELRFMLGDIYSGGIGIKVIYIKWVLFFSIVNRYSLTRAAICCPPTYEKSQSACLFESFYLHQGVFVKNEISMTNAVIECVLSPNAVTYYDPDFALSDDQIVRLVEIATTAPSSFHLQNWRFIAVRTPKAKARLRPIAWNQPSITEAAVTFIVCGQLVDTSVLPERLAPLVNAGVMSPTAAVEWESDARNFYMAHPQRRRDEAIRTATLGAAAITYAARALGLRSTPMTGFDADAVHREFGLAEDEVPVMLVTIGAEREGNWAEKPRQPQREVPEFV
jgi:nitroreductase